MGKTIKTILFILLLSSFLISCKGNDAEAAPQSTSTFETLPSPTNAPDRVVLIAEEGADSWTLEQTNLTLQELAASSGLEYETRQSINSSEITADIKVLVFLSHPTNLGSLSNAAPNTQFIVISDQDWTPSTNVSIIRVDPTYQTFMAGYASVMLADNFRSGGMLTSEGGSLNIAYKNGAKYFCGLCNALIFPYNNYPLTKEVSPSATSTEWMQAFNELNLSTILFVYVPPQAYSSDLFNYIAQTNVKIIGITTPPAEAMPLWAGTFLIDGVSPIREIWNDVVAGRGGKTVNASLYLADTQAGLISQGRQALLNQVIDDLQAGTIYTLDPNAE